MEIFANIEDEARVAELLSAILSNKNVSKELLKFDYCVRNSDDDEMSINLIHKIASFNSEKNLKFLFDKISIIFGKKEFKKYLLFKEKSLLNLAALENVNLCMQEGQVE